MKQIEDKLENFNAIIMREAAEKRLKILSQIEKERAELLSSSELDNLEQAYKTIQENIRLILKEKNEKISRAYVEYKRNLLQKREEIIEQVFRGLINRIIAFISTPEYEQFLLNTVIKGCKEVGSGDIIIYINDSDLKYRDLIINKVKVECGIENIEVEIEKQNIIGGARILNKSGNLFVDNSLSAMIRYERENFLKHSGMTIN